MIACGRRYTVSSSRYVFETLTSARQLGIVSLKYQRIMAVDALNYLSFVNV